MSNANEDQVVTLRRARVERPRSCSLPWEGASGRIRYDKDGNPHFQIRKRIGETDYNITLPAGITATGALKLYERFLENPEAFDARGDVRKPPIYLTADLMSEFLSWSKRYGGRDEKGTSDAWRNNQRLCLLWWMEHLKGKDLRAGGPKSATLAADILPPLYTKDPETGEKIRGPQYRHRVGVLIKFYKWLREVEHRLEPDEDPVLNRLKQPKPTSAQGEDDWKVVPPETVFAVADELQKDRSTPDTVKKIMDVARALLKKEGRQIFTTFGGGRGGLRRIMRQAGLTPYTLYYYFKSGAELLASVERNEYRWAENVRPGRHFEPPDSRHADMLLALAATGWHLSELRQFMVAGLVHPRLPLTEVQVPPIYATILTPGDGVLEVGEAKRGGKLKTRVSERALEIAKRLQGTGGFDEGYFREELTRVCEHLKLPVFAPSYMRHSVSTYATNSGAPQEAVSAFLNHGSSTTRRYYDRGVALKVPTLL
jgi:AcrR family transcriptional regulator